MRLKKRWIFFGLVVVCVALFLSYGYATPVLMYHHVDENSQMWKLSVSAESFSRQMEFLKAHRYHVLSLSDFAERIRENRPVPRKSVVITFDDGYDDNFINAYPVLKKMGFPACIFMQLNGIGRPGYLTAEDLKILSEGGIEIGSHTLNHAFLPDLPAEEMKDEIFGAKRKLERILQKPVRLFSYPGGGWTEEAVRLVEEAGYEAAVATGEAPAIHRRPYLLRRIRISRTSDNLFVFWLKCSGFHQWIEDLRG